MGADWEWSVNTIKSKLNVKPLILQVPEFDTSSQQLEFNTILDIVNMKKITWTDELGDNVIIEDLTEQKKQTDTEVLHENFFAIAFAAIVEGKGGQLNSINSEESLTQLINSLGIL